MQLNVKIDDEVYKTAKRAAKKQDVRLRLYVERALKEYEEFSAMFRQALESGKVFPHLVDGATGGKDDCAPPPEEHVKARGKKKVRGAKPASKSAAGVVRPKINLSRLLP